MQLEALPGTYIRRLQQIAVAIFLQETEPFGLTPVQYAALAAVRRLPGVDQRTLAATIGLDTSTTGGVIDRLEARGLVRRPPARQAARRLQRERTEAALRPHAGAGPGGARAHG